MISAAPFDARDATACCLCLRYTGLGGGRQFVLLLLQCADRLDNGVLDQQLLKVVEMESREIANVFHHWRFC